MPLALLRLEDGWVRWRCFKGDEAEPPSAGLADGWKRIEAISGGNSENSLV